MAHLYQLRPDASGFDPHVRFVRLRELRADGFVEFDFAVGEPGLSVELILPKAAFDEFCEVNRVIHITPRQGASLAHDRSERATPARHFEG